MGAIVRDSNGAMILAASIKEQGTQDPKTVECLAILRNNYVVTLKFHASLLSSTVSSF